MIALYSLRSDGDNWRITKFVDGEPEGSYLVSADACECPAGHRHTCRHRQMLPQMLAHKIHDSMWFFSFDTGGQIVDFNGTSKNLFDQLAAVAGPSSLEAELSRTQEETVQDTSRATFTIPEGYEAIRDSDGRATGEVRPVLKGQHCQGSKPWRRL